MINLGKNGDYNDDDEALWYDWQFGSRVQLESITNLKTYYTKFKLVFTF